jgi:hypothetical protein
VTLVFTWAGGIIGGIGVTLGLIELVTGRLVNPRRWNWTVGEVRVDGLVTTMSSLALAILFLINGLVFSSAAGPTWVGPAWWPPVTVVIVGLPFILVLPTTRVLLEQHHNGRWPFGQRRLDPNH